MKVTLCILSALVLLQGCAGLTIEQRIHQEYRDALEVEAAMSGQPCNIVCGKIRKLYESYKQQMEALK